MLTSKTFLLHLLNGNILISGITELFWATHNRKQHLYYEKLLI